MSGDLRVPGRVFDPTVVIDDRPMPDAPHRAEEKSQSTRMPGVVDGPTEALAENAERNVEKSSTAPARQSLRARLAKISLWQWSGLSVSSLLALYLGYNWIGALAELLRDHLAIGLALSALSIVAVTVVGLSVAREIRAFNSIDNINRRTEALAQAIANNRLDLAKECLRDTIANIAIANPGLIQQFNDAARGTQRVEDYLRQFDNLVLQALDKQADALIRQSATGTGIAVAIIPHPAFDALVVLGRGIGLSRKIGELYGLRPTGLSSFMLFRYTLNNVLLAASVDMGTDTLLEAFGVDLAKTLGKYATEAGVMGYRMYRLGKMTQRTCRPLKLGTAEFTSP